jgi:hypothetical protein
LLSGHVDNRDQTIERLRLQLAQLDEALRMERMKTGQIEAGVRELRHTLTPLYVGLQKIFGEMDTMGVGAAVPATGGDVKWDFWRKRFPGRGAELIDTLLINKSMNTKQLSTALKCDPRTLAQLIYKLNQAGLIAKNGNMFSLKEL